MVLLKLLPSPIARFLVHTGLVSRLSSFFRYASRSLSDVVSELTQNKDLRAVMSYIFGTYGEMIQFSDLTKKSCGLMCFLCISSQKPYYNSQLLTFFSFCVGLNR